MTAKTLPTGFAVALLKFQSIFGKHATVNTLRVMLRRAGPGRMTALGDNGTMHTDPPNPVVLQTLVDSHHRFLAFIEPRVGNRADAEEILQSAFATAVQQEPSLEQETVIAWFFRVLRNALVDHYRRKAAEQRALAQHSQVIDLEPADLAELDRTVCQCFRALLPTLKNEYADLLSAVDLQGKSVTVVADELGITANNAGVRLHRARHALKKRLEETCRTCAEHGCLDCTCGDT